MLARDFSKDNLRKPHTGSTLLRAVTSEKKLPTYVGPAID